MIRNRFYNSMVCLTALLFSTACAEALEAKTYGTILDPVHETVLSTDIQAHVKKVHKDMGDSFEKGDVLVELNDVVYRANFLKSMAMLEKARTQKEAKQELYNDNIVSLFELKEAEAEYTAAEAEVVIQKQRLDSTKIVAPYNGKVVSVKVEEFELVVPGNEIAEIVQDESLVAKMLLPSKMITEINIGKPVYITLKETGETVMGKISRMGAVIDPSSSTIRVEAKVDNMNGKLKAGMTGKASFGDRSTKPELEEMR